MRVSKTITIYGVARYAAFMTKKLHDRLVSVFFHFNERDMTQGLQRHDTKVTDM